MQATGMIQHPRLEEPFPEQLDKWFCKRNEVFVPNTPEKNEVYRKRLLARAEHDFVLQQDLLAASAASPIWWINTFAWTYHQFSWDETGKSIPATQIWVPFILWKRQRELINRLEAAFNEGRDILIDKSRDMGASWICVIFLHWLWLFRPDTQIREMSRVEDYVDGPSSKSLFWKHDVISNHLPLWMCPPAVLGRGKGNRTKLRIHNELNGSTIGGESTTKHAMSGDRATVILLDEFSKVENGEAIRTATADVAPCRIVNSTPAGAGTEYARWKKSGLIEVFPLLFYDHPQKGKGRFVIQDSVTKEYSISSPWLEHERERRSPKEIAQEILAQDLESGDMFFDLGILDKHIALYAKEPIEHYNIDLKKNIADASVSSLLRRKNENQKNLPYSIKKAKNGRLAVWGRLINNRPDQSKTYQFGIDVSKGQGATESVVTIKCKQTGEVVAQWADKTTTPHDLARVTIALALWCGGANPQRLPFLNWEMNGPGWEFGKLIVKEFNYPFYYRSETTGRVTDKKTGKYGFHVSRESKALLLRAFERALMQGGIIVRDKQTLEQAKYYIYHPSGSIEVAELSDKTAADKLLHADRVMSAALCNDDRDVARPKKEQKITPKNSWGARYEAWKKKKKRQNKGWRKQFSFA